MNTFALKGIALLCMVIDHIGYYFPATPVWLHWIGRISYPLFLFCMIWGYHYSKDRKKYLLRLYGMSLFMTSFGLAVSHYFPTVAGYGNHNIFVPLLLVGILISIVEAFGKDKKKGALMLCGLAGMQLFYYMAPSFFPFLRNMSGDVLTGIIPNLAINEYGFPFIALGVLLYFCKERKDLLCVTYLIFCLSQFSEEMLNGGGILQSFMVLALPLMLRYNNEKGPSMKWFFYFFYPAHSFLLFYLANFVFAPLAH